MRAFSILALVLSMVWVSVFNGTASAQEVTLAAKVSAAKSIKASAVSFAYLATKSTSSEFPTDYSAGVAFQTQINNGFLSCSFSTDQTRQISALSKIFVNDRGGAIAQTNWHQVVQSGVRFPNEFQANWFLNPSVALADSAHPASVRSSVAANHGCAAEYPLPDGSIICEKQGPIISYTAYDSFTLASGAYLVDCSFLTQDASIHGVPWSSFLTVAGKYFEFMF